MFGFDGAGKTNKATLEAIGRSLAIIEFDPTGKILSANENFCNALGYSASEIIGQHHSMFVEPEYGRSAEYRDFWAKLGRGEFEAREYERIGKGGREVWIQASYNPVIDSRGKVLKVVKVATDITRKSSGTPSSRARSNAISLVQAVIEFTPAGEMITANENFLERARLQARGDQRPAPSHVRRARLSRSPRTTRSSGEKLNSGEYVADSFKRSARAARRFGFRPPTIRSST